MKFIELPAQRITWPSRCCRCGKADHAWRTHTENVVAWTALAVTRYRRISLPIPVCGDCARKRMFWFAAAALFFGIPLLLHPLGVDLEKVPTALILASAVAAIVCALVGQRSMPINILRFDPDRKRVRLRIHHDDVARALLANPDSEEVEHRHVRRGLLIAGGATLAIAGIAAIASLLSH